MTRRKSMKLSRWAVAVGVLFTTMVAGQCRAQSLRVNIPFDFVVGNTTLPAGEYALRPLSPVGSIVGIKQVDGSAAMIVVTRPADQTGQTTEARLIFHRYGNECFLSQIWTGVNGLQLNKSKREQEMAVVGRPAEFALTLPMASER
jgi:hypothetical protein